MTQKSERQRGADLRPMGEQEVAACRGGDDPFKAFIDWVTGQPPAPGDWPPQKL